MEGYAYYNGKIGLCSEISIPLTDRLIYFADGVYDVIVGHHSTLFLEDEHMERFFANMLFLGIQPPLSKQKIKEAIHKLIDFSKYESYLIYVSASRNSHQRTHSYLHSNGTNLLITVKKFEMSCEDDVKLTIEEDMRYKYCNIKTTNLLPAVLAATKAECKGCDEAIFIRNETITECSHSNIFIANKDEIVTHPASAFILSGIIRGFIIKSAAELGIKAAERTFTVDELFSADEIFITSTTKLIRAVKSINGITVGNKNPALIRKIKNYALNSYNQI